MVGKADGYHFAVLRDLVVEAVAVGFCVAVPAQVRVALQVVREADARTRLAVLLAATPFAVDRAVLRGAQAVLVTEPDREAVAVLRSAANKLFMIVKGIQKD